eukprot:m.132856 g.132856  ORF g.132856 m.132856 type:complete len:64 (-) comp11343_c1_seq2:1314-1505(-)
MRHRTPQSKGATDSIDTASKPVVPTRDDDDQPQFDPFSPAAVLWALAVPVVMIIVWGHFLGLV